MEQYFDIRYELNKDKIHELIALQIEKCKPAYICAADGNILAMVNKDEKYRDIIN